MRLPHILLLLALVAALAFWLLRDDSEAQVRQAHADLAEFFFTADEDSTTNLSVLDLRRLQSLFAEDVSVIGEPDDFTASYTRSEIVGLIVDLRGSFVRSELRLQDLGVEFPEPDLAVVRFAATMEAVFRDGDRLLEAMEVESRMRDVDGRWQFFSFEISQRPP